MSEITEAQIREAVATKAYADNEFRSSLKSDPKGAIEGLIGTSLPEGVTISIVEDTDNNVTFVIPPMSSDELSDEQLEAVAGGFMDSFIHIGDNNFCIGGGLINTKMEINL